MEGSVIKAKARELIIKNSSMLFFVSLIYLLMLSVLEFLTTRLPGNVDFQNYLDIISSGAIPGLTSIYTEFRPAGALLALLLHIFQPVLDFGFLSCCVKTARSQETESRDILSGFGFFAKIIAIFVITSAFIFLWSLLLFIPGIVAAYKYRLAYYILLDDPRKGVFECIDESALLMDGGKLDLFLIDLSFIGWYLLDLIIVMIVPLPFAFRILMLWVLPYRGVTNAIFYDMRKSSLAV